jgi:RNA polymerase sigma-70 factor (ECF subfamily)
VTPRTRAELHALVVQAADGDRTALSAMLAAAWPLVRAYCARVIGDTDADDAAQEALIKASARLARFDRERDGVTWLLTLATWECRTVRRRATRRRDGEQLPDLATESLDLAVVRRDLLDAAAAVLDTLAPADAATLIAAWTDARDDGVAPATFRKRLERALARFRASWRSRHDVP